MVLALVRHNGNQTITSNHNHRSHQVHATNTERYLTGRSLMADSTVKGALTTLLDEVQPHPDPELADVAYRQRLAGNLLYKVTERLW